MINNTTIKITRLSNIIYPSREVVILALDNVYHLIGQFILADYRDELGNINTILVIGKSNGKGHDAYSVISTAGDFVVNKIEIPDVSQVGHQDPEVPHGEIYITRKKIDPNDENSEEDWFLVSCPENERVWEIIDRSRIFKNLDDNYRWFYIKETRTLKREDDFLSTVENQSYVELLLNNLNKPSIVVSYNNQTNDNFYIDELNITIENPILNIHVTDFTGTDITENCIIKINNEIVEPETSDIHDFKLIGTLTTNTEIIIESVYLDKVKTFKIIRFYFPYEMYYGTCNLVNNEIVIDEESINSKLIYTDLTNIDITFNLSENRSIIIFPQRFGPFFHIFDINRLDYINDYTYLYEFEYDSKTFSAYYKNDIVVINDFLQRFTYVENYNPTSESISGGGGSGDMSNYYTKEEILELLGNINTDIIKDNEVSLDKTWSSSKLNPVYRFVMNQIEDDKIRKYTITTNATGSSYIFDTTTDTTMTVTVLTKYDGTLVNSTYDNSWNKTSTGTYTKSITGAIGTSIAASNFSYTKDGILITKPSSSKSITTIYPAYWGLVNNNTNSTAEISSQIMSSLNRITANINDTNTRTITNNSAETKYLWILTKNTAEASQFGVSMLKSPDSNKEFDSTINNTIRMTGYKLYISNNPVGPGLSYTDVILKINL